MGLGHRRIESSCFCNGGCPYGTMPFNQYWVRANPPSPPTYGLNSYLFRNDPFGSPACNWKSVEDHFIGPSIEQLTKETIDAGPNHRAYEFELVLVSLFGVNIWRTTFVWEYPEPGGQVNPEFGASCSRNYILLDHIIFGASNQALIRPAYPEACYDSDFPAMMQTKLLGAF